MVFSKDSFPISAISKVFQITVFIITQRVCKLYKGSTCVEFVRALELSGVMGIPPQPSRISPKVRPEQAYHDQHLELNRKKT